MANDMIPETDEDELVMGDEMLISFDNGHLDESKMINSAGNSGPLNEALK